MDASLVVDCRNHHGEGILWNQQDACVWWTDIEGRKLWSFDPVTGETKSHEMPDRVCCFAPRAEGGMIVAFPNAVSLYEPGLAAATQIAAFEPGNPNTRLNDGRTDRQGRLIAGGMNEGTGAADSSVIRIDPDGSVATIIEGVACANSTCFSPDGRTMFFADTPEKTIRAYDYDPESGTLGAVRIVIVGADRLLGRVGEEHGPAVRAETG